MMETAAKVSELQSRLKALATETSVLLVLATQQNKLGKR